jgi:hypothetical protein
LKNSGNNKENGRELDAIFLVSRCTRCPRP